MAERHDLSIYDDVAEQWWSDEIRWVRTLKNMVPARMRWFSRHMDWTGITAATALKLERRWICIEMGA